MHTRARVHTHTTFIPPAPSAAHARACAGCGSGYLCAVFTKMVKGGKVVGIDYLAELVELSRTNLAKADQNLLDEGNLIVMQGDGWKGVPEHGPYDCIHVGAGAVSMPKVCRCPCHSRAAVHVMSLADRHTSTGGAPWARQLRPVCALHAVPLYSRM